MDKRFLAILVVVVLVFVGIFSISKHGSPSSNAQPTNHTEGQNKSNVIFLEYGDYQCPVCDEFYPAVKSAIATLSPQITYQFRNLPLPGHPNAFAAARAAEAAALQGKFWQMHDMLYDPTNYQQWAYNPNTQSVTNENPQPFFDQYAKTLGLNTFKFDKDYASNEVANSINADVSAFNKTGQQEATPTFFVNGKFVDNSNFLDSSRSISAAKIVAYIKSVINQKQ